MVKNIKATLIILLLGIFILSVTDTKAQVSNTDLSSVKVDELTDAQIKELVNKASLSGLSEVQLEATAKAQGMPATEILKLKERIADIKSSSDLKNEEDESSTDEENPIIVNDNKPVKANSNIFGFSLFTSKTLSFEPSTNIATPLNYQLGPGDNLVIDVWGASQETYKEKISSEGSIIISGVGPVYLSGMTIEEATVKIKKELSLIYSGLYAGSTFMKLSLSTVRSIKVNIVGDVAVPGTYTLSSLATVFNAMYAAGGPSENGSLRDVKIIRDNKTVAELDFYEFLLKGILPNNMRLQDEDIVFVSTYSNRVEVAGQVKRTGFFDMKKGETLKDLLLYAGGYTGTAYYERIKVLRKTDKQKKILDVFEQDQDTFHLMNGDKVDVDSILDLFENRVHIEGAVWRPGYYAIDSASTLQQLIEKAQGLKGDAFLKRVNIYRTMDDLSIETVSLDISDLSKTAGFTLKKEDKIEIASIFDLQEEYVFNIKGEVKNPGEYSYMSNTTVEDLIIIAGGLLESASCAQLEVARRIVDKTSLTKSVILSETFKFNISKDLALSDSASKFILSPFDEVFVRKSPAFSAQELVEVKGEVLFPGYYSLTKNDERVSDLLNRCGSVTDDAYLKGARLIRKLSQDKKLQLYDIKKLMMQVNDSIDAKFEYRDSTTISISLDRIIKNPGSKHDLILKEGDVLYIPKISQTVGLSGALLYPVVTRYQKGYGVRRYIANSGGYTSDAKRSKTYVVYYNGSVKSTHKILFINDYPKVEPGAEIIIPEKAKREGMSKTEVVGLGTALASMALMVVYIINAFK
jgi:protein involved in polysaccharide export with SLBB domain